MPNSDPVIIVGAGPAGLAVAAILAQAGVPSRVLRGRREAAARSARRLDPSADPGDARHDRRRPGFPRHRHRVPRWQIRGRAEGVIVEWDLSLLQDETPYPFRFHCEQFKLTPLLAAPLRGARRHGAIRPSLHRRDAGCGRRHRAFRDAGRHRDGARLLSHRRRRRAQRGAAPDECRLRRLHLAGALSRHRHPAGSRAARLYAQRLCRRSGRLGRDLQDAA